MITYPVTFLQKKREVEGNAFKLTIDTALGTGTSFTLPLWIGYTYDFWWLPYDGAPPIHVTSYDDPNRIYNYVGDGTYNVSVGIFSGDKCGGWSFNDTGDKLKVTSVDQWGEVEFDIIDFYGCSNMTSVEDAEIPYTLAATSADNLFRLCSSFTTTYSNLLRRGVNLSSFGNSFRFSGINAVPIDIFRYNVNAGTFQATFSYCLDLAGSSLPENLFYYNPLVTNYRDTFFNVRDFILPAVIFDLGNLSIVTSFRGFMRSSSITYSYTGTIQPIWDYALSADHIDTFLNQVDIDNYVDIPFDWKGMVEVGTLATDQTTLKEVGISRTFTGIAEINWGDGSFTRSVSAIEDLKNYIGTGTYDIKLGAATTTSTTVLIADDSRITDVSDLKTGLLTNFRLENNLFIGTLDMANAPISNDFWCYSNPNLTGIMFSNAGNGQLNSIRIYSCDITGGLDLTNVPVTASLRCYSNPNLTGITFSNAGNGVLIDFQYHTCDITGILDLSNTPVGGVFFGYSNPNLTGITFSNAGNSQITAFNMRACDITGILDLSDLTFSSVIRLHSNPSLTDLLFAGSGHGALAVFEAYGCTLPDIGFSVFGVSDAIAIDLYNNAMSATEHNDQLINLAALGWLNGDLEILTGNATRTSASDTAYNTLIANGWTII